MLPIKYQTLNSLDAVKRFRLKMQHLIVKEPRPQEVFTVIQKVVRTYNSQISFNNWTSICFNFLLTTDQLKLKLFINFLAAMTLVPILICSNCEPCPVASTFAIHQRNNGFELVLNSTYAVTFYLDPFCSGRQCGSLKKQVRNGRSDPIRIFVDKDIYTWQNETLVFGPTGQMLRFFRDYLRNPIQFVRPCCEKLQEREPDDPVRESMRAFPVQSVSVGTAM